MSSLTFRTLNSHIDNDDFVAFQSFLESHQTQVDDRDENGTTALMVASSKGLVSYVKELLLNGADVNSN
jgi:ankyrin repeat-rich membrane spanning protein